jgi:hypothetical protein
LVVASRNVSPSVRVVVSPTHGFFRASDGTYPQLSTTGCPNESNAEVSVIIREFP